MQLRTGYKVKNLLEDDIEAFYLENPNTSLSKKRTSGVFVTQENCTFGNLQQPIPNAIVL